MSQSQSPWTAVPAVRLAVAVAVGIVAADWLGREELSFLVGIAVLFSCAAGFLAQLVRGVAYRSWLHGLLAILLLSAAAVRQHQQIAFTGRSSWHAVSTSGSPTIFGGLVHRLTSTSATTSRVVLRSVVIERTRERLPGRLLVYLDHDAAIDVLSEGMMIAVRGEVHSLPSRRNPSDFNYGRYLRRRGVRARVFLRNSADVLILPHSADARSSLITRARSRVNAALEANVPDSTARAVVRSLVLGDRSGIPTDVRESFVSSGLVHLLAVSGLHVMIVGMMVFRLLRPTLLRLRFTWRAMELTRLSAASSLLISYMFITGRPPSVVRAVIMAIVFMVGAPFERRSQSVNSLAVAGIIILLWKPSSLFEPGFQLSFSAVLGIVTLTPPLQTSDSWQVVRRLTGDHVAKALAVSVAASISTLPILLFVFGRAPLAGIPLNLIGIPLTAVVLTAGLLTVLMSSVPLVAQAFGFSANASARLLERVAASGSDWLGKMAVNASPHFVETASLVMILLGTAILVWSRSGWKWIITGALLFSLWHSGRAIKRLIQPRIQLIYFDVGHGDATLVRTARGRTILIDAGPAFERYDAGRQTVLPHLNSAGIRKIDIAVLSHGHSDHTGGLSHIIQHVPVGRIVWSGSSDRTEHLNTLLSLAERFGVNVVTVEAGDTLLVDADLHVAVLAPDTELLNTTEENDRSVVIRLQYGRSTFLFTGDAEAKAEAKLATRYEPLLKVNVVKVPHHGSRTSSSISFVSSAVDTSLMQIAVVSVAKRNRYGLPDEEVVSRWKRAGFRMHLSADEHALLLQSDSQTIETLIWR